MVSYLAGGCRGPTWPCAPKIGKNRDPAGDEQRRQPFSTALERRTQILNSLWKILNGGVPVRAGHGRTAAPRQRVDDTAPRQKYGVRKCCCTSPAQKNINGLVAA